jgi:hypothetical protein
MTNPARFQFTLRTLLTVVTLCAVALGTAKTLGLELYLGLFSGLAWSCDVILIRDNRGLA